MARVIIGMDPHKRSAIQDDERVRTGLEGQVRATLQPSAASPKPLPGPARTHFRTPHPAVS